MNHLTVNLSLVEAIASSVVSRLVQSDLPAVRYNQPMLDPFESYHKELIQSDRDPATIDRYWQIITSYREYFGNRKPAIASDKEYLAHLRDRAQQGQKQASTPCNIDNCPVVEYKY